MSRILIRNVRIFETRPPFSVKENMDVLIEESIIKKVGENLGEKAETIIDLDSWKCMRSSSLLLRAFQGDADLRRSPEGFHRGPEAMVVAP